MSSAQPTPGIGSAATGRTWGSTVPAKVSDVVRERAWALWIWAAMAAWTALLFTIVRDGYLGYRFGRFDLGNMVQAVWSTAEGRPLETTEGSTGELMVRLGGHVDPFLVLLAPLWALWPSPLVLALAQIVVVAAGALPVFWLGRRHLESERAAGILALGYLAYPWVATSAGAPIHPVTFAISLYLFCIWFLETERLVLFAICAVLAMSTGELMGVPIACLGVWYAIAHGRARVGGVIALLGVAWTVVAVYLIVPAFSGENSMFYSFYDPVGGSPFGVLRTLVTDPGTVVRALVEPEDIVYLIWLGLPLLGLFLLAPGLAAVALPQLLANGLSDFRSMTDPRYHSVAAVIPFLVAATVLGIARLRGARQVRVAGSVLVCSAVLTVGLGPWSRAVGVVPLGGRAFLSSAHVAALMDAIALIPEGARVTTSNPAGAHLSARRYVYSVPYLGDAEWALVDTNDPWVVNPDSPLLTHHPEIVAAFAKRLERDGRWRRVFDRDGVLVFRRLSG